MIKKMIIQSRKMYINKNYTPSSVQEDDEIYRSGIFHFNITKILEDIHSGKLVVEKVNIDIKEWFRRHGHSAALNESHLPTVDIENIIIQAEIRPGIFSIIDGNHRIENAFGLEKSTIRSYKLMGEQFIPYFITCKGYEAFVEYWNLKLR